jgi:hypothetical protein
MAQSTSGIIRVCLALAVAVALIPVVPARAVAQDAGYGSPRTSAPSESGAADDETTAAPTATTRPDGTRLDTTTTDEQPGGGSGEPVTGSPVNGDAEHAAAASRGTQAPAATENDLLNEVWSANGGG